VRTDILVPAIGLAALGLLSSRASAARLIEFGWDEPDTAFMRAHIREMEQTPFDGCVFHLTYVKEDGSPSNFTWECWSTKTFTREQLWHAVDDLKALDSDTFTSNFLRFNVTPGDVDWFDDFGPILANARLAGQIAKAGKCPGISFDIETYNAAIWHYPDLKLKDTKTWDEYAAQVRKRGAEVMQAFQAGYPDITVFLTFGYCLPWVQAGQKPEGLPNAHYGLLAPFLDGMFEAADPKARIVDGYELAYTYKQREQFEAGRKLMAEGVLPIVADPVKYKRNLSIAFGIWMDCDWRNRGWATGPFMGNFFHPMELQHSLEAAFDLCDEYVWLYTETPRWWSAEGPQKLPSAYERAVRKAKKAAAK
jgi:hypothetical protein